MVVLFTTSNDLPVGGAVVLESIFRIRMNVMRNQAVARTRLRIKLGEIARRVLFRGSRSCIDNPAFARCMLYSCLSIVALCTSAQAGATETTDRWKIAKDGGVVWSVAPDDAHTDFIEMDGEEVGLVIRYGIDGHGIFSVSPEVVWPSLRFFPNLTGSALRVTFGSDAQPDTDDRFSAGFSPSISVRGGESGYKLVSRTLHHVRHDGITRFDGTFNFEDGTVLDFKRAIFPSLHLPAVVDTTVISNNSRKAAELLVDEFEQVRRTSPERGVDGAYTVLMRVIGSGSRVLHPGESTRVSVVYEAHKDSKPPAVLNVIAEEEARTQRVAQIQAKLKLQTPDPVLNTAFEFAKIHTTESIFRTKVGLLHSPGGGRRYYAAIWANDQAEYADPFFGMLGDETASEAALNSFREFARFINPGYRPIPSAVISEGARTWDGAGDRGDMAMIAYGAARFALASGKRQTAEELWPLIEWCLEYLRRKVTPQGVVASDSDELEGRFPAGKANLNTSSLYYDALRSVVYLGGGLGKNPKLLADYAGRAVAIKSAIERYFGAQVDGFETYRYYDTKDDDNVQPKLAPLSTRRDVLRSWIATPLNMGILDRKDGTLDALFSPRLWSNSGVATEEGQDTYWDRSTLYALRGAFAAGAPERGLEMLRAYSMQRLLGDHVPYPVEAYPEAGGAQLAAESALYCRVFTEGLFGIRPTGLRSFDVTPRLPDEWTSMALRNVHAFGDVFDLEISRQGGKSSVIILREANHPIKVYNLDLSSTQTITLQARP